MGIDKCLISTLPRLPSVVRFQTACSVLSYHLIWSSQQEKGILIIRYLYGVDFSVCVLQSIELNICFEWPLALATDDHYLPTSTLDKAL